MKIEKSTITIEMTQKELDAIEQLIALMSKEDAVKLGLPQEQWMTCCDVYYAIQNWRKS